MKVDKSIAKWAGILLIVLSGYCGSYVIYRNSGLVFVALIGKTNENGEEISSLIVENESFMHKSLGIIFRPLLHLEASTFGHELLIIDVLNEIAPPQTP